MKLKEIIPGIIHVDFESQIELAETFVRIQEHYESPKFKGEVFTLGEFRDWYSRENGGFTYYTDWDGFNIPSHIIRPFRTGVFDPLSEKEKTLLETLPDRLEDYYIIGTFNGGQEEVLEHEICHGLYYIDDEYKAAVDKLLCKCKNLKEVKEYILKIGYHEDVLMDEVHAYISSHSSYLKSMGIKFPDIEKDLRKIKKNALNRLKK